MADHCRPRRSRTTSGLIAAIGLVAAFSYSRSVTFLPGSPLAAQRDARSVAQSADEESSVAAKGRRSLLSGTALAGGLGTAPSGAQAQLPEVQLPQLPDIKGGADDFFAEQTGKKEEKKQAEAKKEVQAEFTGPLTFDVVMYVQTGGEQSEKGNFTVRIHRDWAPIGARQFKALTRSGYYKGSAVFRVVPGVVAQFGLPAKARQQLIPIPDDPPKVSNKAGTITFGSAGPNTRTSQIFFNLKDNTDLDQEGYAPIGEILGDGLQVVKKFYAEYGEKPDQSVLLFQGNRYLDKRYPLVAKITNVVFKEDDDAEKQKEEKEKAKQKKRRYEDEEEEDEE
eukprot:TRINITY_DN10692_c0_g1_i2.p1 TRINITY_DN10692_c0_g1~~TRINITY_DN10692_c0_g1_i2.p1  ORF type:complete len:337 (+),score=68.25 TRINITY_DN10692_c0_g1_i2:102-1112(+)